MPIMNGFEATKEIRRLEEGTENRIAIVGLSGNARGVFAEMGLDSGMTDYMVKYSFFSFFYLFLFLFIFIFIFFIYIIFIKFIFFFFIWII
jgi:hypothetical protein